MPPANVLPVSPRFASAPPDEYIDALLAFAENPLLRTLCGGIHILDFFTRDSDTEPQDIYRTVVPADWIAFFAPLHIDAILDLLMRTPPAAFPADMPATLHAYIADVRAHTLDRTFVRAALSEQTRSTVGAGAERALNAGMKPKKIHEVCVCRPRHARRAFSCIGRVGAW